jgi:hypothetical protein
MNKGDVNPDMQARLKDAISRLVAIQSNGCVYIAIISSGLNYWDLLGSPGPDKTREEIPAFECQVGSSLEFVLRNMEFVRSGFQGDVIVAAVHPGWDGALQLLYHPMSPKYDPFCLLQDPPKVTKANILLYQKRKQIKKMFAQARTKIAGTWKLGRNTFLLDGDVDGAMRALTVGAEINCRGASNRYMAIAQSSPACSDVRGITVSLEEIAWYIKALSHPPLVRMSVASRCPEKKL